MVIGPRGLEIIKRYEGFRPTMYYCVGGYPTIGYGHVIRSDEQYLRTATITEAEAVEILVKDVARSERSVKNLISVALTQGQFDSLVSFTFNLGGGALQRSTLRSMLNRGEYYEAACEFSKWVWAGGQKRKGLILRRRSEALLFLDTVYETEEIELPTNGNGNGLTNGET